MKNSKPAIFFFLLSAAMFSGQQIPEAGNHEQQLETVVIRANTKKGAANNLLSLQRKAVEMTERVGAEQLHKQGVGDAATAVTKASGTQKQQGSGQLSVRGLGDRYNSTTLNGLPVPSDDPEYKNLNLSLFTTSVIEYISLHKVYQPKLQGDFGGAGIEITSKEHSGKPFLSVSLGSSINLQTAANSSFFMQDGAPGYLGYHKTTFSKQDPQNVYPFRSSWNFDDTGTPHNSNLSLEGGTNIGKFSVFGYTGFSNDYSYSEGQEGFYDASGDAIKALTVDRYSYRTNHSSLLNVAHRLSQRSKIAFTSNFIHSSAQEARFFRGYLREIGSEVLINRGDNKITSLFINQLYGSHQPENNWQTDWGISYNVLQSDRPDRLQNTIDAHTKQFITASTINNHRYFDALNDRSFNGFIHFSRQLGRFKVLAGYQGTYKQRHFDHTTIGLNFTRQFTADPQNVDAVINAANNDFIRYNTFRTDQEQFLPFWYEFKQNNQSAFLHSDFKLSEKVTVQLGGRYDYIHLQSSWDDAIFRTDSKEKEYNKFLPTLNFKYEISSRQNLRFSASKTYILPQAKELVPIGYYDVTTNVYGNPSLYPSDMYHADLKWELFSGPGEVISAVIFGKYLLNPISRTTYSTAASSDMTYFNIADYGMVAGAEVEIRKDLFRNSSSRLYTFLNATVMYSDQKLKTEQTFAQENNGKTIQFSGQTHDKIQGVADLLANLNLGYQIKAGEGQDFDFVVSYSYAGESVFALGTNRSGNFYETPVHQLDAHLRYRLRQIGLSLSAKNLLNPDHTIEQRTSNRTHIHKSYSAGTELGLTLSYQF